MSKQYQHQFPDFICTNEKPEYALCFNVINLSTSMSITEIAVVFGNSMVYF